MFRICLALTRYNISKVEGCLKALKLDSPTTKKQIKTRYFQLAKQLHPDVKDENGATPSAEKLHKRSQAFIEITKAYKFLNDLSEAQINNPSSESSDEYFGSNTDQSSPADGKKQQENPLSPQQRTRRATYAYFNKRYRRQGYENEERKKEPLYKQIPEFFVGCLFVALFLIEWGYTAFKRSAKNIKKDKNQDLTPVIEGFSFKKKFEKNIE